MDARPLMRLEDCRATGKVYSKMLNAAATVMLGVSIPAFNKFVIAPALKEEALESVPEEQQKAIKRALKAFSVIITISSITSIFLTAAAEVSIWYAWKQPTASAVARSLSRFYAFSAVLKTLVFAAIVTSAIAVTVEIKKKGDS